MLPTGANLSQRELDVLNQRVVDERPIAEVAKDIGMTESGVSKMVGRIIGKVVKK
jgi:DNA-directed RNA polymerase specialized sigma subunit